MGWHQEWRDTETKLACGSESPCEREGIQKLESRIRSGGAQGGRGRRQGTEGASGSLEVFWWEDWDMPGSACVRLDYTLFYPKQKSSLVPLYLFVYQNRDCLTCNLGGGGEKLVQDSLG